MLCRKYVHWYSSLLILTMASIGCSEPQANPREEIAFWIDEEAVPVSVLKEKVEIKHKTLGVSWEITEEDFARIIDGCISDMVKEKVIRTRAEEMGLETKNDYGEFDEGADTGYVEGFELLAQANADWLKRVRADFELIDLSEQIALRLSGNIEITDEELRGEYEKRIDFYIIPEVLEHQVIKVDNSDLANDIHKQLTRKRSSFESLAQKHSSIRGEGALGEVIKKSAGDFPGEHEEDVLALKEGQISPVLTSSDGYYIYKIVRKYPKAILPFESVEERLRKDIVAERRSEIFRNWLDENVRKITIRYGTPLPFYGDEQQ